MDYNLMKPTHFTVYVRAFKIYIKSSYAMKLGRLKLIAKV